MTPWNGPGEVGAQFGGGAVVLSARRPMGRAEAPLGGHGRALVFAKAEVPGGWLSSGERPCGPGAGVERRENSDRDIGGEAVAFAALGGHKLAGGDILLAHHAATFVRADNSGAGVLRDDFRASYVVEVGVADEDEVSFRHIFRHEPDFRRGWHPVHVGIEEDDGFAEREAKCGATEPIELDIHVANPPTGGCYRKPSSSARPAGGLVLAGPSGGAPLRGRRMPRMACARRGLALSISRTKAAKQRADGAFAGRRASNSSSSRHRPVTPACRSHYEGQVTR